MLQRIMIAIAMSCDPIYLGAQVMQGSATVGQTTVEPNVLVEGGRIVLLSGQIEVRVPYALRT